jgi:hypothetical protein
MLFATIKGHHHPVALDDEGAHHPMGTNIIQLRLKLVQCVAQVVILTDIFNHLVLFCGWAREVHWRLHAIHPLEAGDLMTPMITWIAVVDPVLLQRDELGPDHQLPPRRGRLLDCRLRFHHEVFVNLTTFDFLFDVGHADIKGGSGLLVTVVCVRKPRKVQVEDRGTVRDETRLACTVTHCSDMRMNEAIACTHGDPDPPSLDL